MVYFIYIIIILVLISFHYWNHIKTTQYAIDTKQYINNLKQIIMSKPDSDRVDELVDRVNSLEVSIVQRLTALEVTNKLMFGGYSFISIGLFLFTYLTK